jgi:hypothetical protein
MRYILLNNGLLIIAGYAQAPAFLFFFEFICSLVSFSYWIWMTSGFKWGKIDKPLEEFATFMES